MWGEREFMLFPLPTPPTPPTPTLGIFLVPFSSTPFLLPLCLLLLYLLPHFNRGRAKIKSNLRAKAKWDLYPCQESKTIQPIGQGDVILLPVQQVEGQKIPHLTLVEGEITSHKHCITEVKAELSKKDSTLYLRVISGSALLAYEKHKAISIPQSDWMVKIQ